MRTTMTVLILAVGALALTAFPASAGDDDKGKIAQLESELARRSAEVALAAAEAKRMRAEVTHLREAYNQLSQTATRATRSLESLTNSLTAARDMLAALTQQGDQLRGEVKQLRSDIVKRPADDPARLKLALRDAQTAHARAVTQLQSQLSDTAELASRRAVSLTIAESALAAAKDTHASEIAALQAKLAKAEATIKQLRAAR